MNEDSRRASPAEVVLHGLDALEVVLAAGDDRTAAMVNARSMLDGLDEDTLRRVAAYLAGCTVRVMRAGRPVQVERVLQRWRLEATAELTPERPGGGRR